MKFKQWLESSLKGLLEPVPQSPIHHSEGNVFIHSKMVRKQLNSAISHFQEMIATNPLFSNFSHNLTSSDINLLRIGAWLHDIGKASATTLTPPSLNGEEQPSINWKDNPWNPESQGKIKAIGHEDREHFEPMMQKLGEPWQSMYLKSSVEDKEDLWYIIKHHMDLKGEGFGKRMLGGLKDSDGKFKNERRIKLLLILIMMDQSGRIAADMPEDPLPEISSRMTIDKRKPIVVKARLDDPIDFIKTLKNREQPLSILTKAFERKFQRPPTEIELANGGY